MTKDVMIVDISLWRSKTWDEGITRVLYNPFIQTCNICSPLLHTFLGCMLKKTQCEKDVAPISKQ